MVIFLLNYKNLLVKHFLNQIKMIGHLHFIIYRIFFKSFKKNYDQNVGNYNTNQENFE